MKGSLFFVHAGITAKGCFTFSSSHALNSTNSLDLFSAALISNGLAIAATPFDSSNCFKLDFVLPEPGKHQLEISIAEVMNGSVTIIGNASTPVIVEVLQREGEHLEWLGGETWKLVGLSNVLVASFPGLHRLQFYADGGGRPGRFSHVHSDVI